MFRPNYSKQNKIELAKTLQEIFSIVLNWNIITDRLTVNSIETIKQYLRKKEPDYFKLHSGTICAKKKEAPEFE